MSFSPLLKNSLASLHQDRLRQLLTVLRQPFSLAVMASIGIHALLWVLLPLLTSSQEKAPDTSRTIGVVELSPIEQLRLPELVGELPAPGASSPAASKPAKATDSPQSTMPDDGLYSIPLVPPPPVTILPPILEPPPLLPPLPPPRVIRVPSRSPQPADTTSPPDTPDTPDTPEAEPTPVPTEGVRPEKIPEAAIAALREKQAELRQKTDPFAFSKTNTTEAEFTQNISRLSESAKSLAQGNLDADWKRQKEITDLYPKAACPAKVKGLTWVGALFRPDGKLEGKPEVLLSSGYSGLDQVALNDVSKQTVKSGDKYQALIFPFRFEPTEAVCPAGEDNKPARDESPPTPK